MPDHFVLFEGFRAKFATILWVVASYIVGTTRLSVSEAGFIERSTSREELTELHEKIVAVADRDEEVADKEIAK